MARCPICYRRVASGGACPEHGARSDASGVDDEPDWPEVAAYTLHARLGRGGFAEVFLASRIADGTQVALKIAWHRHDWRFAREVEALRRVPQPHVPEVLGHGTLPDGRPYLAMQLVGGRSLADWLVAQKRAISPRLAMEVLRAIADVIDAIHGAAVIHRDIKPENLMLHERGVTAIDFGLARIAGIPDPADDIELAVTLTGQRVGTPTYMAPEQCLGRRDVGPEVDTYAVGVIAFELLCSRPPFIGAPAEIEQAHVEARVPAISRIAGLPPAVDGVLARALAKDRRERFATAGALCDALAAAMTTSDAAQPSTAPSRARTTEAQVVVLALRGQASVAQLRGALQADDGELVHTSPPWYVAAFPRALSIDAGIRTASAVASRLASSCSASVIHVASLRLRAGRHGLVAVGADLDRVGAWTPRSDAPCVLFTPVAAAACPDSVAPWGDGRFYAQATTHAVAPVHTPLRGRSPLVEELDAERARCVAARRTGVTTILGEVGAGKSRIVHELALLARAAGAEVVELSGAHLAARSEGASALADLIRYALGVDRAASRDELAAAVELRLGRADTAIVRAVAVALDLEADPGREPGLSRRLLASGLGEVLRRRAAARPLVVALDDAHWAEPVLLDALDAAAISEGGVPLWLLVAAQPRFRSLRPDWGERAGSASLHELAPLDTKAAREVLLDLLHPAEFIPDPVLARVVGLSAGLPVHLVELAQLFRREGRIRRLRGTESFYLAGDDLLRVSTTPLAGRLAERMLRSLPRALTSIAWIVAILEHDVTAGELDGIVQRVRGNLACELDPGAGLSLLVQHGLLTVHGGGHRFRSPMLAEAIRGTIPVELRGALHAAAADQLGERGSSAPSELARLGMHAAASGRRSLAADVFVRLGDRALREHDDATAEQHFTAALGQLDPYDTRRAAALAARGRARLRTRQLAGASDDFRAAHRLAESRDERLAVECLLEEATVHDWAQDFAASEELVTRAGPIVAALGEPALAARWHHGVGRSAFRRERMAEAAEELARAASIAREIGDHETHVTALLLLGCALSLVGRLEDAEREFEEVIAVCERAGDQVNLGGALGNRIMLWMARHDFDRAVADLERSKRIARVAGHVQLERTATHNLAELLLWLGRHEEALVAARRSQDLEQRYYPTRTAIDPLLIARILCARGELDQTREQLARISAAFGDEQIDPSQRPLLRMVRLACEGGDAAAWGALVDAARPVALLDELLEIISAGVAAALTAGDAGWAHALLAQVRSPREPWASRFDAFAVRARALDTTPA